MAITITGANLAEIVAQVAELTGGAAAPAAESTGRGRGGKKDKDTDAGDKNTDAPKGPTVEEIRELASKIETDDDQDKAIAIIAETGAESISGLEKKSAETRQKVYDQIEAIVAAATKKASRKALA